MRNDLLKLKMTKYKKAQLQMGETIVVLLVFFILVLLGFVFYVNVMKSSISSEIEEIRQQDAIKVAQKALFLPELQCSSRNIEESDCVDLLKLRAAAEIMIENQIYYYDTFGFSKITVEEIYPASEKYTLYDNPLEKYQDKIVTFLPVEVYDSRAERSAFGIMVVEMYAK